MNKPRVVITGFGCVSALGPDVNSTYAAIKQGQSGIAPIEQWDSSEWEYHLAAEIKNYDPKLFVADRKLLKLICRHDVLGLGAARQAVEHSQLITYRDTLSTTEKFNDRTGIFASSPGNKFNQQYDFMSLMAHAQGDMTKFSDALFEHVHPMWLLRILPNNVLAYTGIQFGFKGANQNVTNHGVSGAQAIIEATHSLQNGSLDRAVVVGYESCVEPQSQMYYGSLGVLSNQALQPYDKNHSGTVMGEGAGAMVLETLDSAQARKATIFGEILGGATTTEAMGIFSIREDGVGVKKLIEKSLYTATLSPDKVGMITGHANGNSVSDASEAAAITQCFGHQAIPVTGFKWAIGHTLAAAGVMESIFTLLALREKNIPGIANLQQAAAECEGLLISNQPQQPRSAIGMIITRGFGAFNSSVILSAL